MRDPALERAGPGRVVTDGRELVYLGGCDYLGLAGHPRVVAALRAGLARWGVSAGASRATSGDTTEHRALEDELARFLGQEACVLLPEGWLANVALLEALAGEVRLALVDAKAHMSLPSAARAAGVHPVPYEHADVGSLRATLEQHEGATPCVLTDGLFPSLGRCAPLDAILRALPPAGVLVVDDCHGTGVIGARGRGTHEELGVDDARMILTGTLSKALGCYGGFVAGSARRMQRVRGSSSAYLGTTPVPPALAAAGREALRILLEGEVLATLRRNVALLRAALDGLGLRFGDLPVPVLALEPPSAAVGRTLHEALLAEGFLVPLVRYPGGPDGAEDGGWLRLAVHAAHAPAELERLAAVLRSHLPPA
jgi:7-keto-8-aminopelargonate synthetase-like enzyme